MSDKKMNATLCLAAMVIGVVAVPVTALVNTVLGLILLGLPIFMVYKAS